MSVWLDAARASARRELGVLRNRPWEVFAVVLAPVLWMALTWGLLAGGLPTQLPLSLVDLDDTSDSRAVARAIAATRSAALAPKDSLIAAQAALAGGETYGVVHIPAGYSRELARGTPEPVVVYLNEQYFPAAGALEKDIRMAVAAVTEERLTRLAARAGGGFTAAQVRVEVLQPAFTSLGNPALNYQAYLGTTLLPGLLQLFAVMAFIGAIVREYREQTVAAWLASAGGSVSAALAGKLAPWVLFYLALAAGYVAWVGGWAGWAPAGNVGLWILALALLVLAMLAVGAAFAALAPDWRFALTLGSLYVAPSLPFSGFSYPLVSMSETAQIFGSTLPITWFLRAQAQQWTLASPIDHAAGTLLVLAAFALLPWLLAAPLLARKLRRLAAREAARP